MHSLAEDRQMVLWVLHVSKEVLGEPWLTPAAVASILRDAYGINIPRQRVQGILSGEGSSVASRRRHNRTSYQVMKAGSDEVTAARAVVFVEPGKALSRLREVQSVFADLKGQLLVCDPYADGRTLDMLAHCSNAAGIRLLTMNVKDRADLQREVKAFTTEHVPLEVRIGPTGQLHDRYVIHDRGLLVVGTSLNSLGLKQSFVVEVGPDIRSSVERSFTEVWKQSKAL